MKQNSTKTSGTSHGSQTRKDCHNYRLLYNLIQMENE